MESSLLAVRLSEGSAEDCGDGESMMEEFLLSPPSCHFSRERRLAFIKKLATVDISSPN